MSGKPDTDWFKRKLAEHRLSQSGLGRMMGIDKSTMSLLLNGKRRFTVEYAADMARILGETTSEVMRRMGVRVDGIRSNDAGGPQLLLLEGWIDAAAHVHPEGAGGKRKRAIDAGTVLEAGASVLQFRTPQSRMDILDGWIVVIGARRAPDDAMIGSGCVVGTKSGAVMMRAVRRGYSPGRYMLFALDAQDDEEEELEWYAPILLMKPATN